MSTLKKEDRFYNRCNTCVHYGVDVLNQPCLGCIANGIARELSKDFDNPINYEADKKKMEGDLV